MSFAEVNNKTMQLNSYKVERELELKGYYQMERQIEVFGDAIRAVVTKPVNIVPFFQAGRLIKVIINSH